MPNRLQRSVHARTSTERTKVLASFAESPDLARRQVRMSECASHGRLYLEGVPPAVHLWIHRCADRLCPNCAKTRAKKIEHQLINVMTNCTTPRHLVLTIRTAMNGCLKQELAHLMDSFRRFRRSPGARANMLGGAYSIEVKYNVVTSRWHPHLHVLYDGQWWAHRQIKDIWKACSDGSEIVWITEAKPRHARYLASYAGKPPDLIKWPAAAIREYAAAMHGVRMVQTFGSLHSVPLSDSDDRREPAADRSVISLGKLRLLAAKYNPVATAVLYAAAIRWPMLRIFATDLMDLPPPQGEHPDDQLLEQRQAAVDHSARFLLPWTSEIKAPRSGRRSARPGFNLTPRKSGNDAGSRPGSARQGATREHQGLGMRTSKNKENYLIKNDQLFSIREWD